QDLSLGDAGFYQADTLIDFVATQGNNQDKAYLAYADPWDNPVNGQTGKTIRLCGSRNLDGRISTMGAVGAFNEQDWYVKNFTMAFPHPMMGQYRVYYAFSRHDYATPSNTGKITFMYQSLSGEFGALLSNNSSLFTPPTNAFDFTFEEEYRTGS